jgi:hypothetical protein
MNIKVGDAVMTPEGRNGVVTTTDSKNVVVAFLRDGVISNTLRVSTFACNELTRLIPDTGLEERVREWAESLKNILPGARRELLALLDTPEAEPEDMTASELAQRISAGEKWVPEPPPDAGVTREEPTLRDQFAMAALAGLMVDGENPVPTKQLGRMAYGAADAMLAFREEER